MQYSFLKSVIETKKIFTTIIALLFFLLTLAPLTNSETPLNNTPISPQPVGDEKELDLLRGEHYLYLNATVNVDTFHVHFAFPPDYHYQVPILFELLDDTTADVLHYQIDDEHNEPNKVINFTIGPLEQNESVFLHFIYWVLVKNFEFDDLPEKVQFPHRWELPEEAKIWLTPTDVVQTKRILIRLRARQLRGLSNNLLTFAERIAKFTRLHRYGLFLLQLWTGTFGSQDALTTLFRNGECPGRSHLGSALFRSQTIPARIIMAGPSNQRWYQMHFMTEFYLPNYGWILTEVHKGIMPFEPKHQIIMRICYPEDEMNTHTDYFFPKMTGIEYWFWIDNDHILPYYKDLVDGSRSNMFRDLELMTDAFSADYAFFLTNAVFHQYEHYLGMNLTGEDLLHFQNAVSYQKQSITEFIDSENPEDYIYYIDKAYDEYQLINP
jgi:hypothetical protein